MSWHCSAALVEVCSRASVWDTELSAQLKMIRSAERSFFDAKRRKSFNHFPSGMTSIRSMGGPGMAESISLALGFPAKPSAPPDSSEESEKGPE